MADVGDRIGPAPWIVESRRSHYSIGYWVAFVLGTFGQMVPPPPRLTYVVRHGDTGERRTVTLPGDHRPADLAGAVERAPTAAG